jgi:cell wall-associated NlpC family hydrolase
LRPGRAVLAPATATAWSPSTIRRQLSLLLRVTAVLSAFICVLATAPAASARSVAGEYSPAATLTTEAPVVFQGATDAPADALIDTPVLTPVLTAQEAAASPAPAPDPRQLAIATALEAARSKLGAPYSYGSAGPYAFDCSGFTRWAYQQAGIVLPHYSGAQWANSIRIPLDQLQPGDLVFNWEFGGGDPDHVGLYVGDGMMIHSPNSGGSVRYDSIWWWTGARVAAARLA